MAAVSVKPFHTLQFLLLFFHKNKTFFWELAYKDFDRKSDASINERHNKRHVQ